MKNVIISMLYLAILSCNNQELVKKIQNKKYGIKMQLFMK